MNNLLSYCGLVDARISASEKDLPVYGCLSSAKAHGPRSKFVLLMKNVVFDLLPVGTTLGIDLSLTDSRAEYSFVLDMRSPKLLNCNLVSSEVQVI